TAILSNAQAAQRLLATSPANIEEFGAILSDIVDADKRAGEVIHRMHALLKKEKTKLEPIDVNDVLTDALGLAHSELVTRRISVATQLASGLPDVLGDHVQLQQVLLNLVMNACQAMATNDESENILEVSTARDGPDCLRFTIADCGPGIPPEL